MAIGDFVTEEQLGDFEMSLDEELNEIRKRLRAIEVERIATDDARFSAILEILDVKPSEAVEAVELLSSSAPVILVREASEILGVEPKDVPKAVRELVAGNNSGAGAWIGVNEKLPNFGQLIQMRTSARYGPLTGTYCSESGFLSDGMPVEKVMYWRPMP